MKYKCFHIIMISCVAMIVYGCSSVMKKAKVNASYNSEKGSISVALENIASCNYSLKINEYVIGNGTINENGELNILNQIKSKVDICKEVALLAAKNNNELQVSLSLTNLLDTTFIYHLIPSVVVQDDNVQFTGVGAMVISKSASRNVDEELKHWLFRKNEVVSDSLFSSIRTNYLYLTETNNNDFVVRGEIPVVHSLSGNKYSVSCNMKADYYAVVACGNQKFIDKFVENSVVKDYKNLSTSKSNIVCVPEDNESGYFCIVLLGINKDYSYQQLPIAVVAKDNVAPNNNYLPGVFEGFNFKNKTKVHMPKNATEIFGNASVRVAHWDGNGLECNVTFLVNFAGDAKSATIHRRGELCYPDKYLGNHLPVANKVLFAKDGYEQRFTWKMHFDDGDNEIPVTVEDYHGNKREYNVVVRAEFVRSDAPQIDIDNNIDIYN